MSEWQPIETAPKDGTSVLAWSKARGSPLVMRWDDKKACWRTDILSFIAFDGDAAPTYWMSLPDPPQQEQTND